MNTLNKQNLKTVLSAVPAGFLVDAAWLTGQGIAYETFRDYVKRGWLDRVTRGVFMRPDASAGPQSQIDWQVCLLSLQHIMGRQVHVGGTTALAQQGYGHYLPLGAEPPVWIYGADIPAWVARVPLTAQILARPLSLFVDPELGLTRQADRTPQKDWQLVVSTPERAILEALDTLPQGESFHTVDMIFEGLTTLRPRLLTQLLKSCRKIKVKRLFFVFADRHNHAWNKPLEASNFDLGAGDRALVTGGKIHPKYRIMVPAEFAQTEAIDGP